MLPISRSSVTRCVQSPGSNSHRHATGFDVTSLQNSSAADAHCSEKAAETRVLSWVLALCAAVSSPFRLPMKPISTSTASWVISTRGSRPLKTQTELAEITASCKMYREMCSSSSAVACLRQLHLEAISVIQEAVHVDTVSFQQDGVRPHKRMSRTSRLMCSVAASCQTDLQSASGVDGSGHRVHRTWIPLLFCCCRLEYCAYLTVQKLQGESRSVAEQLASDMFCDIVDNLWFVCS